MTVITEADPTDSVILSGLAARSEAYWGYDYAYMENFRQVYNVTEGFIKNNPTFLLKNRGRIIGFYGIKTGLSETVLEYFFIEPDFIGKGYGKELWDHLLIFCRESKIPEFIIVTSPQAKQFYEKLGAEFVEEVDSLLKKGRRIPKLIYRLVPREKI